MEFTFFERDNEEREGEREREKVITSYNTYYEGTKGMLRRIKINRHG